MRVLPIATIAALRNFESRRYLNAMPLQDFDDHALTAFQVSCDALLAMALLARRDLDAIDNLILLGISQANVRKIVADPEFQRRYAFRSTVPPDDLRKPISIAALSRALGVPLETVRRRAARLAGLGLVAASAEGLVVPGVQLDTAQHNQALMELGVVLSRAHSSLAAAGFFHEDELPTPSRALCEPPSRAIGRLAGDYYLRMLAPLCACCGDPIDAVIVLFLLQAGVWPGSDVAGTPYPVGPAAVARALRAAPETMRRRLRGLVDAGICRYIEGGYVIPANVIEGLLLPRMAAPSQLNLRRLFRQIAALSATEGQERIVAAAGWGHAEWR